MPKLDVTTVLLDPLFAEKLLCVRQAETVTNFGEVEIASTETPFYGVITAKDGEWLQREDDAGRNSDVIMLHTKFKVLGIREGGQPDTIFWQERPYTVKRIYDWSKYGAGFVAVELEAQNFLGASHD